jgi:hypothetical protein
VQRLGGRITAELDAGGQALELEAFDSGALPLAAGQAVHLRPARYRVFAADA